jgi:hypothetical protein
MIEGELTIAAGSIWAGPVPPSRNLTVDIRLRGAPWQVFGSAEGNDVPLASTVSVDSRHRRANERWV